MSPAAIVTQLGTEVIVTESDERILVSQGSRDAIALWGRRIESGAPLDGEVPAWVAASSEFQWTDPSTLVTVANLDASVITTGVFADARLSANVPRLDAAANTFAGAVTLDDRLLMGTAVTTASVAGDIVLKNTGTLRGINAAGSSGIPLVSLDASNVVRLASSGLAVAIGTVTASATAGDLHLGNNKSVRGVNAAGNSAFSMIRFGADNKVQVDASANGVTMAGTLGVSGKVTTSASTTSRAGFNVPHGAAPTSPVNGDVWTTTAGVFARINGSTVQLATV